MCSCACQVVGAARLHQPLASNASPPTNVAVLQGCTARAATVQSVPTCLTSQTSSCRKGTVFCKESPWHLQTRCAAVACSLDHVARKDCAALCSTHRQSTVDSRACQDLCWHALCTQLYLLPSGTHCPMHSQQTTRCAHTALSRLLCLVQVVGPAHFKGCKCKRSRCIKKYCDCYDAQVRCSDMCK